MYGFCSFVGEFVWSGPKIYAFSVFFPSNKERATNFKVKGITLNFENSKVVNFTRDMILENTPPMHVHNPRKMKGNHGRVVVSESEKKF